MIESILLNLLTAALGVPVYVMRPEDLPSGRFIVLDRIGTTKENYVTSYTVAVQSYGTSALDAAELNESVIATMEDEVLADPRFARVHLSNSQMQTDTVRKRARYQSTFDIVML